MALQPEDGVFTAPDPLVINPAGVSPAIVVCEHASCFIPPELNSLGLDSEDLDSHVVWDPGAMEVANGISNRLDAVLVASQVSRLVYDCNRPPTSTDAIPERSERYDVPGNRDLSSSQRAARIALVYEPFRACLETVVSGRRSRGVLVTVHSFTPVYNGNSREVEIGILHDRDTRLSDIMLRNSGRHTSLNVQRNEPYGPADGVTHTLRECALPRGMHNVMIEIRNDLLKTGEERDAMAAMMSEWIVSSLRDLGIDLPGEAA